MGSLCSKPDTLTGGHTLLGSNAGVPLNAGASSSSDPRAAAAEAAERRLKAVSAFLPLFDFQYSNLTII